MVSNACPHWLSLCILFLLLLETIVLLNSSRIVFAIHLLPARNTSWCMWSLNLLHIPISRNQNAMDRFIIWRIVFLNQSMAHVISLNWHITFIGVHITEEKETYRVYRCLCFVDSWCNNMSFLKYSTNLNSILIYFTHNSVCLSFDIRILITPFSIFKLVSSSCETSLLKIELLLQSYFSFCLIYMSMQSTDSLLTFFYY